MSSISAGNPLSSWLSPLLPASWIHSKALHFQKSETVSLVGYGTVASMVYNNLASNSNLKNVLIIWGCAEAAFYVFQKWRYFVVNSRWTEDIDLDRVQQVKERFLGLPGVLSIQDFLSGWFHGAPFDSICRDNVLDFVAYGFYSQNYADLTPRTKQSSQRFVSEVEKRWGIQLPPGRNSDLVFMAHLWEPLRVFYKPLLIHMLSEGWGWAIHLYLRTLGFHHAVMGGMSYWVRNPTTGPLSRGASCDLTNAPADPAAARQLSKTRPVVFLHGVGFGLTPYIHFMRMLFAATASHPMIILEFRHVSMRLCLRAAEVDHAAHAVAAIVRHQGFKEACVVGHSFGTFVASRLCQLHPDLVQSLLLHAVVQNLRSHHAGMQLAIDPVCMMTCSPQLLHSFVYKTIDWGWHLLTPLGLMDLARYVCSRDLIIAEAFCRKFCWHSLMLWPEDMPAACTVSLSANDDLVPCELVHAQLKAAPNGAKVLVHPTAGHGGYLVDHEYQKLLVQEVRNLASRRATV